ncbi:hypothetical protein ETD86_03340 [Nonomuraea turkmeniaca]|uniref:Saccharopine dehydrogenase n=1 Tax=Nonomuraea turkmeniaca TaxID=103838 RepID=A0A5S4FWX2_9ACTN|nr:hypothetical protein [Nonomuraea turkmeniaca]TMR24784.1 hypothetical protein ETD86_03340 [Nonomuraea turkmeniaca]
MSEPLVGVIGATGTAGRAAVAALTDLTLWDAAGPPPRLRLGSRKREAADRLAGQAGHGAQAAQVDITDEASLRSFSQGCDVVLTCAGPSFVFGDRVARAVLSAGADFADVSGYDPVHARLSALDPPAFGRTAVLSAGIYPGLSTLLPRWLARQGFDKPTALTVHLGGLEAAPEGSAADLVLSLRDGAVWGSSGSGMAAWRDGRRADHVLRAVPDTELPFYPDRVSLQPFLSREAERLATDLGLVTLDWYNVFAGSQTRMAFTRMRTGQPATETELAEATQAVMRASMLDLSGREPYYLMVYRMDGLAGGVPVTRTAVLRTRDTYQVTGMVGALAVRTLLAGTLPPGAHYAGDALDPETAVAAARRLPAVGTLEVIEAGADFEAGTL